MALVLGYIPSGSRCGNIPNKLVHRAGSPFLDNHYRGYQCYRVYVVHTYMWYVLLTKSITTLDFHEVVDYSNLTSGAGHQ